MKLTALCATTTCLWLLSSPLECQAFVIRPIAVAAASSKPYSLTSTTTKTTQLHLLDAAAAHQLLQDAASTLMTAVAADTTTTSSNPMTTMMDGPPESAGISYSRWSYYTILGLYLLSFPGLWSTIKRSTSAKIKRKVFVSPGENAENNGKSLRQQAGEIMACTCRVLECYVCLSSDSKHRSNSLFFPISQ